MDLGIDFGTTRTIVAQADRGNYPVVSFYDANGDAYDFFPSLVALVDGELVYGLAARQARDEGAPALRSLKRQLTAPNPHNSASVMIGGQLFNTYDVLLGFMSALYDALHVSSSISDLLALDPLDKVTVAVPAHAHSAQRYLTLELFKQAGFKVAAMLNEPSAAGFEYTHRLGKSAGKTRSRLVVYDLGGGTFDASLIDIKDRSHKVLGTTGINHLGGDDFDYLLCDMACEAVGISSEQLGNGAQDLLAQAQSVKEQLVPQSKRMVLDVAEQTAIIQVPDYYEACKPLLEETVSVMSELVDGLETAESEAINQLVGIYLVGGASSLPIVPRMLREIFGRRVFRSPYPAASAAIGLAIAADPEAGYTLSDQLSRGFGVFREAEDGERVQFDAIFTKDQPLDGEVELIRHYRAVHNQGWYRFVEFNELVHGQPVGDIIPLPDVRFPYVTELQNNEIDLANVPVTRGAMGHLIEEIYLIDRNGICSVTITDLDTGWQVTSQLGLI